MLMKKIFPAWLGAWISGPGGRLFRVTGIKAARDRAVMRAENRRAHHDRRRWRTSLLAEEAELPTAERIGRWARRFARGRRRGVPVRPGRGRLRDRGRAGARRPAGLRQPDVPRDRTGPGRRPPRCRGLGPAHPLRGRRPGFGGRRAGPRGLRPPRTPGLQPGHDPLRALGARHDGSPDRRPVRHAWAVRGTQPEVSSWCPRTSLVEGELREGDIVWFVLDPEHPAGAQAAPGVRAGHRSHRHRDHRGGTALAGPRRQQRPGGMVRRRHRGHGASGRISANGWTGTPRSWSPGSK